jgi:hypothetical protein
MNFISCEDCGVILDLGRIEVPSMEGKNGEINDKTAGWRGRSYEPKITCPVCKAEIFYADGDKVY